MDCIIDLCYHELFEYPLDSELSAMVTQGLNLLEWYRRALSNILYLYWKVYNFLKILCEEIDVLTKMAVFSSTWVPCFISFEIKDMRII